MKIRMLSVFLVVVSLSVATPVLAQEEPKTTIVFSSSVLNSYLGVNGHRFYDGPVNQSDLLVVLPNGFSVDVWGSIGLDNIGIGNDFDDEIDVTVGWSTTVVGFVVSTGISYFAIVDDGTGLRDVLNPYLDVSRSFTVDKRVTASPYVRVEHYRPHSGTIPHQGWLHHTGMRLALALSEEVDLAASLGVVYDTGAFGFDRGWLQEANATLLWHATERFSLGPTVSVTTPAKEMRIRKQSIAYGLTTSVTF